MRSPRVVACHPAFEALFQRVHRGLFLDVDVLVFEAPPQPLDEHVVHPAPFAIHADFHAPLGEPARPFCAGELAALIRVKDLRHALRLRLGSLQREQAKRGVHRVAHRPAQHAAGVPVHHRAEIGAAAFHRDVGDVGDVGAPHLISTRDVQITQQVGMDAVRLVRDARAWLAVDGLQAHLTSQTLNTYKTRLKSAAGAPGGVVV